MFCSTANICGESKLSFPAPVIVDGVFYSSEVFSARLLYILQMYSWYLNNCKYTMVLESCSLLPQSTFQVDYFEYPLGLSDVVLILCIFIGLV